MLRILKQSARTEVNVVAYDKADLEIVLRVWTGNLGLSVHRLSLLEFEEPVQFPGTLLKEARRDDEPIELVILFVVGVGLGLGRGSVVGRSGTIVETKIGVSIR